MAARGEAQQLRCHWSTRREPLRTSSASTDAPTAVSRSPLPPPHPPPSAPCPRAVLTPSVTRVSFANSGFSRSNMTEAEVADNHPKSNGSAHADAAARDDVFDPTYKEKEGPKPPLNIVWKNIFLMGLLHLGAAFGLSLVPAASAQTLLWTVFCYMVSALGITAGAHRLWSHRSYKASLPLRIFLAFANSMAFQNDIYEWARDHRVHHKYSESDADPHNARRGFFFSHIGWLLVRKHPDVIEKGRKLELTDLAADPVIRFQRKYYKPSVVLMCFLVPTLVPWYFWGESLQVAYFVPGLLRYTVVLNATWLVNSAAHMWGNRPYDKSINPRENKFVAFSALGEGFHNYHHTFPYDYATSEFGCRVNLTTFFIDTMCRLGLASDAKRVSRELIHTRIQRTGDGTHRG
ncbi:acyl-CoA desaturase [Eucyclogobius newberryi]|uniref:acyl-CoA desaturase n=1 Tax=Eucyclogobius newberryi TaxID=166745 RepID=UPI003B5B7A24